MKSGFTLIEILIALVIMAVLLGTAVLNVGAGMKSAHLRDAARVVQLYTRHAKAVALMKQRPVVITFEEIMDGGEFQKSRISLAFSGDAAGGGSEIGVVRGGTSETDGMLRTVSGALVGGDEQPGIGDDGADAGAEQDPLMAEPREFEGVRIHAMLKEERETARPRISVFSNVDFLLKKTADEKAKKREQASANGANPSAEDAADGEREEKRDSVFSAVYETNGRCDPFVVRVYKNGTDEADGLEVCVGRFGRVVTGN